MSIFIEGARLMNTYLDSLTNDFSDNIFQRKSKYCMKCDKCGKCKGESVDWGEEIMKWGKKTMKCEYIKITNFILNA